MFKLTGQSGRRNASPTAQTGRTIGLTALRGGPMMHPQRPAFLADTAQESTFDSNTSRVNETA
jgi:hypothetical protein